MSRRPDVVTAGTPHDPGAPSTGVVVTGALAVLVVIMFVASVAFGAEAREEPGDRVALVRDDEGYAVLVGRCDDERVRTIELRSPDETTLWRVESENGSFERRFVVGAPAFGFAETVPLQPLGDGEVEVFVEIDDVVDGEVVDVGSIGEDASVGAACGDSSVGAVGWVFALGAGFVVASYGAMLLRYRRERRGRG